MSTVRVRNVSMSLFGSFCWFCLSHFRRPQRDREGEREREREREVSSRTHQRGAKANFTCLFPRLLCHNYRFIEWPKCITVHLALLGYGEAANTTLVCTVVNECIIYWSVCSCVQLNCSTRWWLVCLVNWFLHTHCIHIHTYTHVCIDETWWNKYNGLLVSCGLVLLLLVLCAVSLCTSGVFSSRINSSWPSSHGRKNKQTKCEWLMTHTMARFARRAGEQESRGDDCFCERGSSGVCGAGEKKQRASRCDQQVLQEVVQWKGRREKERKQMKNECNASGWLESVLRRAEESTTVTQDVSECVPE